MTNKTISINNELYRYMLDNWLRESDLLTALREETMLLDRSNMQISPDQGQFMAFLIKLLDARKIIEIGTFTGYSALVMAKAAHVSAKLVCCDVSEEWTALAKKYWQAAGVDKKIDLRVSPALETLSKLLPADKNSFDFAFIDADKENYDAYYEACLELLKPGGIIAIDNVFWGGSVIDQEQQDVDTVAIRRLNKKLHEDYRIDLSIVPIGDGLTLARKR